MPAPNILLIHSDQHRFDCMGINGHPLIRTPNLDRLAREGANFTHAFCPIPVCSPARTSLLTGLWPTQHGCLFTEVGEAYRPMRPGLPTFCRALKDWGYYLGYVGKWHVDEERDPTWFGFDDYLPETNYGCWRQGQGIGPRPRTNGYLGELDPEITPDQSRLAWGAGQVIYLLEGAARQSSPFLIRWDPSEPHLPNVVPEPYASMYPPSQIQPWPSFPDPLAGKPYIQRQQQWNWGVVDWTWKDWAPIVGRYLGEISLLDTQIGFILEALDVMGLAETTLVIYTADHGDLCGAHGMIDKHYVMYDDVVRVPLIMRWPERIEPGRICDGFVSSAIDLAATFYEATGLEAPASNLGKSLLSLAGGVSGNGREDILATYFGNQFGLYSQRMVRDRRWKYIWNLTARDELYDLKTDPAELTNLAAKRAYGPELERLRQRLMAWMEAIGDPLLNRWTRRQLEAGQKLSI